MRTADWTESASVLDRITAVLGAFGEPGEGLGVTELARRANLPKSTVSRIAADLVGERFLDRDGDRLYLGVRLFELGQGVQEPRRLRGLALPVMNDLRRVTGMSVEVGVLDDGGIVLVSVLRRAPSDIHAAAVGTRLPLHATALGKAVLAFSPASVVDQALAGGIRRHTPQTIADPAALRRELLTVRSRGVAIENEEHVPGRVCAAAPVQRPGQDPVVAIAVSGGTDADPGAAAAAVRAAASTLARRLTAGRH